MRNYFKRLFGPKKKGFMFTTRNLGHSTPNGERMTSDSVMVSGSGTVSYGVDTALMSYVPDQTETTARLPFKNPPEKVDQRKVVEPKAVFDELKQKTPEISFDNLDEKIRVVSERIEILKEHLDNEHLKDEHMTLFYLQNRKKYLKTKEKFPINWAMTTRDAVDDLCKNYKLKVVAIKQYYTLLPKEGISELDRYTKAYKAITGDNPIFELIIKDADAKTQEGKQQKKKDRDPILIANSPFGNALFVLGAWDEEVEIVDEIIYNSK